MVEYVGCPYTVGQYVSIKPEFIAAKRFANGDNIPDYMLEEINNCGNRLEVEFIEEIDGDNGSRLELSGMDWYVFENDICPADAPDTMREIKIENADMHNLLFA